MRYEMRRDPRRLPSAEECRKTTELLNTDAKEVPVESVALKGPANLEKGLNHRP
jgi:hypothetical protein